MATTVRTLLNNVLRTVGETEIGAGDTSVTSTYGLLVLTFLNQIKDEVEAATPWRALRQELSVSVTGGSASGTISGANEKSSLVYVSKEVEGLMVPVVFDVTDAANPTPMTEVSLNWVLWNNLLLPTSDSAPSNFAIDNSSGDTLSFVVSPRPTSTRNYKVVMTVPQARFSATDVDTVVKVPTRPIEMGTIWYALLERGEEHGTSGLFTEERYRAALDDAVSLDMTAQGGLHMVPV